MNNKYIISIILLLSILVILFAGWFIYNSMKKPPTSEIANKVSNIKKARIDTQDEETKVLEEELKKIEEKLSKKRGEGVDLSELNDPYNVTLKKDFTIEPPEGVDQKTKEENEQYIEKLKKLFFQKNDNTTATK